MTSRIKMAACGLFLLASAAGCRQERPDSGLDSDPPAAGSVREKKVDPQDNPTTDPLPPTVEPAPSPGTSSPAPAPGTDTRAPGSSGTMRSGTRPSTGSGADTGAATGTPGGLMNDSGTGQVPPPTGGTRP